MAIPFRNPENPAFLTVAQMHERFSRFAFGFPMNSWYLVEIKHRERLGAALKHTDFYRIRNGQNEKVVGIPFVNEFAQKGFFLAMDMKLPEVAINTANTDWNMNQNRGIFIDSKVVTNRDSFPNLSIAFYETNASISDILIRPWIHNIGFAGSVARTNGDRNNFKNDISITLFTKAGNGKLPKARKTYHFYDVYPVKLAGETKTYKEDLNIIGEARVVEFAYNYVEVENRLTDDEIKKPNIKNTAIDNMPGYVDNNSQQPKIQSNIIRYAEIKRNVPDDGQYPIAFAQRGDEDDRTLLEKAKDKVNQVINDAVKGLF